MSEKTYAMKRKKEVYYSIVQPITAKGEDGDVCFFLGEKEVVVYVKKAGEWVDSKKVLMAGDTSEIDNEDIMTIVSKYDGAPIDVIDVDVAKKILLERNAARAELAAERKRADAAEADAERYRWLRMCVYYENGRIGLLENINPQTAEEFDMAVDDARK
jgi:glutathione synthase/RimK-type ligase-like ATP-grasp enzyme